MNFECPYCHSHTTITDPNYDTHRKKINISPSTKGQNIGFNFVCITCPNQNCRCLYLQASLTEAAKNIYHEREEGNEIQKWKLLPESSAKVLQDYIPNSIRENYYEACRIKDLSPKASATLSRRCLQGMIRDFFGVKGKKNLWQEIEEIKDVVDPDVWNAIDGVRSIGNIGAHMEEDINYIIDVDPDEAQSLISLIELLLDERYVARQNRKEKVQKVTEIADKKKDEKSNKKE